MFTIIKLMKKYFLIIEKLYFFILEISTEEFIKDIVNAFNENS